MRTLIYARYSSTLQNPRSIEDQLAACRARAQAEGWSVIGEFFDRAISGAAGIDESQRPGLAAMLERLTRGDIDQVLTESTDRIARHQGDAFAVRELIEHAGARAARGAAQRAADHPAPRRHGSLWPHIGGNRRCR